MWNSHGTTLNQGLHSDVVKILGEHYSIYNESDGRIDYNKKKFDKIYKTNFGKFIFMYGSILGFEERKDRNIDFWINYKI